MTPKEKAVELFNKMDMIISTDQDNWKRQCIRCAIIGVEEILQEVPIDNDRYFFWQNVKLELERL